MFGQQQQSAFPNTALQAQQKPGMFGASAATPAALFGQSTASAGFNQPPASNFNQQSTAANPGMFNQPNSAVGGMFNQNNTAAGGMFNQNNSAAGGMFNQNNTTAGGMFNQSAGNTGGILNQNTPTAGLFGQVAQPSGGLFGQTAKPAFGQPAQPAAGMFGQPAQPAAGMFGQPAQPAAGMFGQPAQPAAGMFGQPAQPAAGMFGQPAQPAAGMFGQPAQPKIGMFGQPSQGTAGMFGQPSQASSGMFGQTAQPITGMFGQPAQQTSGMFGQPAQILNTQQIQAQSTDPIAQMASYWNPQSQNCVFKFYFYNLTHPSDLQNYISTQNDELYLLAQRNNPDPTCLVPVLATGFGDLHIRIQAQTEVVNVHTLKLAEISRRIEALHSGHFTKFGGKLDEFSRKGREIQRRVMGLMRVVQCARNRGYPLLPFEGEFVGRVENVGRQFEANVLRGRVNEIWATVIRIQESNLASGPPLKLRANDENKLVDVLNALKEMRSGLMSVTDVVKGDLKDLEIVRRGYAM